MIKVEDLSVAYGGWTVLDGVSFAVPHKARLAILGANGAGKSTLAHCLAGWLAPGGAWLGGTVSWRGRAWQDYSIAERAVAVQLVGQLPAQHLTGRAFTVVEEISFGPENLGLPAREVIRRRDRAIALCRLDALADRAPFTLSGGEQQRLVLAAALALEPAVLILDEPFTNLDPESRAHLLVALGEVSEATSLVVFETNPDIALAVADRFVLLQDGKITVEGDARQVLLSRPCVQLLGLPAMARGFRQLPVGRHLADTGLPLTEDDAAHLLRISLHA